MSGVTAVVVITLVISALPVQVSVVLPPIVSPTLLTLPLWIPSPSVSLVVSVVVAVVPLICSPRSFRFHLLVKAPVLVDLSHLLLRIWYPIGSASRSPLLFLSSGGDDLKTTG